MGEILLGGPIPDAYVNLPGRGPVSFAISTYDWERDGKPQDCRLVSVPVARVRRLEIHRPGEVSSLTIASAGGVPDWFKALWDMIGDHDYTGWPAWRLNTQTLEFEPQHSAPMFCRIFMEIDAEDPAGREMWWWWIGEKCVRRDYRKGWGL